MKKMLNRIKNLGTKTVVLIVACVLLAGALIVGTIAYFSDASSSLENIFRPAAVECEVTEDFANNQKDNIQVTIPETASDGRKGVKAYVRVAVVSHWEDSEGNVVAKFDGLPELPASLGENWVLEADGYYYYTAVVEPGDSTSDLFTTAISAGPSAEGYIPSITVVAEAIQAAGGAVSEVWPGAPEMN